MSNNRQLDRYVRALPVQADGYGVSALATQLAREGSKALAQVGRELAKDPEVRKAAKAGLAVGAVVAGAALIASLLNERGEQ